MVYSVYLMQKLNIKWKIKKALYNLGIKRNKEKIHSDPNGLFWQKIWPSKPFIQGYREQYENSYVAIRFLSRVEVFEKKR